MLQDSFANDVTLPSLESMELMPVNKVLSAMGFDNTVLSDATGRLVSEGLCCVVCVSSAFVPRCMAFSSSRISLYDSNYYINYFFYFMNKVLDIKLLF